MMLNSFWYSSPPAPPPGGDPYFSSVVLLLHGNGTDASTTIADSSGSAHTVTAQGNAQIDTAQFKFGGASILLDGTGDYVTIPDSNDFDFGTADWTIEWWQRWNSLSGYQTIFDHGYTTSGGLVIQTGNGNGQWIVYTSGSARATSTASTPSTGVWYHYAVVQSGTTITIYRDGTSVASGASSVSLSSMANVAIGGRLSTGLFTINGWIDDLRITKGVARYTADFTPPTAAFPDS